MQIEICHICYKLVSCKLGMEVDDFGAILRCGKAGGSGSKPFFHTIAVLSSETPGLRVGGKLCRFPMGCRVQDKLVLSKARDALGLDQCKIFIAGRWEGRYCHVSSVVDSASA